MTTHPLTVLTAVTGRWEASLTAGLDEPSSGVEVVRRCADLGELLSAAAAGLARAVVLSGDLRHLDRDAVSQLLRARIAVVGLAAPGDDDAARRLGALGVHQVLPADAPAERVAQSITAAVLEGRAGVLTGWSGDLALGVPWPGDPGPADPAAALAPAPQPPSAVAGPTQAALPDRGKVVAVWGPAGAPGRTTVAVTLAAELAQRGRECLLVDADTHGASIAQTLGLLDESAGLVAAARAANQGQLDVQRLGDLAPLVMPRLRVLTGLPHPRRWTELRPSALDLVWEQARALSACVVVDAGFGLDADEELMFDTAAPRRNGTTLSALGAADAVLAVGAGDPIGLQRLLAGLSDLREVTGDVVPVQVVITKVRDQAIGGPAADRVRGALARYAGVSDPVLIPDDRRALDAAMLAGRTLTELAPSSPARLAIDALAGHLLQPGQPLHDGQDPPVRVRPSRRRWLARSR